MPLLRLTSLDPAIPSSELTLAEGASAVIGRAPTADFQVPDLTVGRLVGRLLFVNGVLHIEDLASGGGSAVEIAGERIERYSGVLPDGAVLWVGGVGFRWGRFSSRNLQRAEIGGRLHVVSDARPQDHSPGRGRPESR